MRLFTNFCLASLLLLIQPKQSIAQSNLVPFTSTRQLSSTAAASATATISDFNCSISKDKVILQWKLADNQLADRLVIQRSRNGKTFEMVGLVFGTDKEGTEAYAFYEKLKSKRSTYRIIIIHKDQSVEYSTIAIVQPEKQRKNI